MKLRSQRKQARKKETPRDERMDRSGLDLPTLLGKMVGWTRFWTELPDGWRVSFHVDNRCSRKTLKGRMSPNELLWMEYKR